MATRHHLYPRRAWQALYLSYHLGIFSPEKLDDGSLMLLDYIDFKAHDNSIDLGCGYGVLGMTAGRECPNGQHILIDKDFVAVDMPA